MSETNKLEELKKQIRDCVVNAFNEGHKAGLKDGDINNGTFAAKVKEAYDNGLNDAWECAKKIYDFSGEELSEIFPKSKEIPFYSYSASEAMTRIKEYEDRQKKTDDEIHIGDEIYCLDKNHKSIVVGFTNKALSRCLVMSERGFLAMDTDTLHKTGRTYPVKEMFEKLNESEE